ncbi:MAG TPA: hydrogenase maturation nickel metallochaperone HypA [Anaerolineae bacterium]|nr:hydrogenase maturation nickel metallochaperone HypA [Anaerolineae bacterium]
MHELPVTEALLSLALEHAQKAGAKRIVALHLVIGDLASIVDDSVQFYWDIISQGTMAEGATLDFQRVSAVLRCRDCGHEFRPDGTKLPCPQCGSINIAVVSGDEFRLDSIDVE